MKDYLVQIVRAAPSPVQGRNVAREYLQARMLGALQRAGAMIPLAFHGGTALRFLFATARYSEDMDFALEQDSGAYDFRAHLWAIRSIFAGEGYQIEIKISDQKPLYSAFVRFRGLPHELGLSPHRNEVLAIKIEVDTGPPSGAGLDTSVVRRHVILHLQHHDRASLLAGKLHALLQRPYTKGRDLYDLLWYVSDPGWPEPNLILLNNALNQTGWDGERLTGDNWRGVVRDRIQSVDWGQVDADVRPFLEHAADLDTLKLEYLLRLLDDPGSSSK